MQNAPKQSPANAPKSCQCPLRSRDKPQLGMVHSGVMNTSGWGKEQFALYFVPKNCEFGGGCLGTCYVNDNKRIGILAGASQCFPDGCANERQTRAWCRGLEANSAAKTACHCWLSGLPDFWIFTRASWTSSNQCFNQDKGNKSESYANQCRCDTVL